MTDPRLTDPDLSLPLPPPDGADPAATLSLGALAVWQTSLATLRAAASGAARLPLLTGPAHPRLASGARILLRTDGPGFLDAEQAVRLDIAGHPPAERRLTGQALADALDLLHEPATGRLLDGLAAPVPVGADGVTVVAFYLPAFHPFAENDAAWGEGFTEWANVVGAQPRFPGHAMPLLPADLGFYDARLPDVRRRQGELARQYGVDAFCYHFYWFSGRRVMPAVLDDVLHSGQPALPFCLCWANETWSRRWDGSENEVIVAQEHDPATDETLFADLLPFLGDPRYLLVDGAPVLLVYRMDILREPERVFAAWRAAAVAHGFPGLFIAAARSFGLMDAGAADATVEFPPHGLDNTDVAGLVAPGVRTHTQAGDGFTGRILDYRSAVVSAVAEGGADPAPVPPRIPGIMPRWDNTPRRGDTSHLFHGSTPAAFGLWASLSLARAAALPPGRRMMFVNAWNEWGEGAMLEPDRRFGRGYLEALRQARAGYAVGPAAEGRFRLVSNLPPDGAQHYLDSFAETVTLARQALARLGGPPLALRPGPPEWLAGLTAADMAGLGTLDHVHPALDAGRLVVQSGGVASVTGWAVMDPASPHEADRIAFLALADPHSGVVRHHLPLTRWTLRTDVRAAHAPGLGDEAAYFGFTAMLDLEGVAAGTFGVQMLQAVGRHVVRLDFGIKLLRV